MPTDSELLLESARKDLENGYTVRAGTRLRQAANTGLPQAVCEFAKLVLTKRVPGTDSEVRRTLETIATPSPEVARLRSCLRHNGIGGNTDLSGALSDLNMSAQEGHPFSVAEIAILWNEFGTEQASQASRSWFAYLNRLSDTSCADANHLLEAAKQFEPYRSTTPPPPLETWPGPKCVLETRRLLSKEPEIYILPDLLSSLECAWLRDAASPHLIASQIYDAATGTTRTDPMRTSDAMYFSPWNSSPLTRRLIDKMLSSVKHEVDQAEPLAILRYRLGQEYKLHYDWLNASSLRRDPLRHAGQRISTVLVYLNSPATGGHTVFPRLDLEVSPKQGDLLYFSNMDLQGHPSRESLHAGAPVTGGEKWISSLWIREGRIQP